MKLAVFQKIIQTYPKMLTTYFVDKKYLLYIDNIKA